MKYYRCKCGKSEAWGSQPPPRCSWCKACESDPASSPELHSERTPHLFDLVEKVETDNGESQLTRCRYCLKTRKEVEKLEADAFYIVDGQRFDVIGPVIGMTVRSKLGIGREGYSLHFLEGNSMSLPINDLTPIPNGAELCAVPPCHA